MMIMIKTLQISFLSIDLADVHKMELGYTVTAQ